MKLCLISTPSLIFRWIFVVAIFSKLQSNAKCCCWSNENLYSFQERHAQWLQKFNVWNVIIETPLLVLRLLKRELKNLYLTYAWRDCYIFDRTMHRVTIIFPSEEKRDLPTKCGLAKRELFNDLPDSPIPGENFQNFLHRYPIDIIECLGCIFTNSDNSQNFSFLSQNQDLSDFITV